MPPVENSFGPSAVAIRLWRDTCLEPKSTISGRALKRKEPRGFTLFELLIVLVVISLMSAMVIPRLSGHLSKLELKTAAKRTAAVLRYARNKAATDKVIVSAAFDFENRKISVYAFPEFQKSLYKKDLSKKDKDSKVEPRITDTIYPLPDGIGFLYEEEQTKNAEMTTVSILFFPNGSCSGGTITLGNENGKRFKLKIDPITGSVDISE